MHSIKLNVKIIFIFLFLFSVMKFSYSSLIFESRPKNLLQDEFKNELRKIQEYKSMSKIDLGNYTFTDEKLGDVEISQIKQEIQYFDINNLNFTLEDNTNQILTGKDGAVKLQYSFVYKILPDIQDRGSFNFESTKYTVIKSFNLSDDKILQQNGTVTQLEFISENIIYEGDMSLKNLIEAAIKNLPTWANPKLLSAYQQDFQDYYRSKISNNRTVLTFQTKVPEVNCSLDLTRDKLPFKLNDENMLFYLSGKLNEHENLDKEPLFDQEYVGYQVYLHKEIFNNIFADITKEGLLDFSLTEASKPPHSPFYLNIQSLGQAIPELYDLYPRDEEIKVYSKIINYEISPVEYDRLGGFFTIRSIIYMLKDMSDILTYDSRFSFKMENSLEATKLNFYLENKGLKFVNLKLDSSSYKKVNKDLLITWTDTTLKSALAQNFYLLQQPLELKNYFSQISEVKCNQNGCLLKGAGKSVLNPILITKKNTIVENEEKPELKFLEE